MPFYVYILQSLEKNKFYIGFTAAISERLVRHNQKSNGFTGTTNDWVLVYQEEFDTKTEALGREKQIKSWKSSKKIRELLASKTD